MCCEHGQFHPLCITVNRLAAVTSWRVHALHHQPETAAPSGCQVQGWKFPCLYQISPYWYRVKSWINMEYSKLYRWLFCSGWKHHIVCHQSRCQPEADPGIYCVILIFHDIIILRNAKITWESPYCADVSLVARSYQEDMLLVCSCWTLQIVHNDLVPDL